MTTTPRTSPPPKPDDTTDPGSLPRPLTIFLTADEHRAVTRALRSLHKDRARAVLRALNITTHAERSR